MNRRYFIKIAGVSFAGLIIKSPVFENSPNNYLLVLPDKVFIHSGNQLIELASSDQSKWTGRDVEIMVKEVNGVLQVMVSSPTLLLNDIQLHWKYKINSNAKCMGDH